MYNYQNKQDIYRFSVVLPKLSNAALFVQDQENKTDSVRMLLTDFVKAHTFPYN